MDFITWENLLGVKDLVLAGQYFQMEIVMRAIIVRT
jgi:hypothetical protein